MATPDLKGTCDALAARFAPGTITTPTSGLAMRAAYGQMPNTVPATPAVYIEPTDGEVTGDNRWAHEWNLDAVFLVDKSTADPKRIETQRQLWLPTLLGATQGQVKLGIGAQVGWELAKALPTGWKWDEVDVAGTDFAAIRVSYRVWIYETVSLVA